MKTCVIFLVTILCASANIAWCQQVRVPPTNDIFHPDLSADIWGSISKNHDTLRIDDKWYDLPRDRKRRIPFPDRSRFGDWKKRFDENEPGSRTSWSHRLVRDSWKPMHLAGFAFYNATQSDHSNLPLNPDEGKNGFLLGGNFSMPFTILKGRPHQLRWWRTFSMYVNPEFTWRITNKTESSPLVPLNTKVGFGGYKSFILTKNYRFGKNSRKISKQIRVPVPEGSTQIELASGQDTLLIDLTDEIDSLDIFFQNTDEQVGLKFINESTEEVLQLDPTALFHSDYPSFKYATNVLPTTQTKRIKRIIVNSKFKFHPVREKVEIISEHGQRLEFTQSQPFQTLVADIQVMHYSNGQDEGTVYHPTSYQLFPITILDPRRSRTDYKSGNFSTNYLRFGAIYNHLSPNMRTVSTGLYYRWDFAFPGFAEYEIDQKGSYGYRRFDGFIQWKFRIVRSLWPFRKHKFWTKKGDPVYVPGLVQHQLRFDYELIVDNIREYDTQSTNDRPFSWSITYENIRLYNRTVGFFAKLHVGRDPLNIRYNLWVTYLTAGLTFRFPTPSDNKKQRDEALKQVLEFYEKKKS